MRDKTAEVFALFGYVAANAAHPNEQAAPDAQFFGRTVNNIPSPRP